MRRLPASADQAVYHDFIVAPETCASAKRLYCAFVVDGPVSAGRLDRAIGHAVATHESLRTSVEVVDGALTQVIREPSEITETAWTTADWDGTPEGTSRIIAGLDDRWTVPRELAIRVVVGRSPQGRTLVACVCHHVCVDGIAAELVAELIRAEYDRPSGEARPGEVEQFSGYYPPMLADGLAETYDDWLAAFGASSPAVPGWMLEKKLARDRAWTRFLGWDLSEATLGRVRRLTVEYGCSPFEALAACTAVYFRREDGRPAGIGVAHSGRHRPRGFEVVGLVRSYVLDVADFGRGATVREAVRARRDAFRRSTAHLSRLPSEEACRRAGVFSGWRAGALGPWQVELSGMYEGPAAGAMGGFAVEVAPTAVAEDSHCENTGPIFQLSFTIGPGRTEAVMRFIDPPVTRDMAAAVAFDIESVVEFVVSDPDRPLDSAPAFFRVARKA